MHSASPFGQSEESGDNRSAHRPHCILRRDPEIRSRRNFTTTRTKIMADKRKAFLLEPPESLTPSALMFLRHARFRLLEDYFVKIAAAIDALDDEQVWRRPNESSNSIGNLLLHLSGNVRQWIISGVGGVARQVQEQVANAIAQFVR